MMEEAVPAREKQKKIGKRQRNSWGGKVRCFFFGKK